MHSILLISPGVGANRRGHQSSDATREPLGILAIGSYLKYHGYKVEILDANLYSDAYIQSKIEQITATRPIFIGLSVMTAQLPHALEMSKFVKRLNSTIPIVWGGIHPTLFPEQTSLDLNVDLVVFGPGESTTLEIARKIELGDLDFVKIKGTACKGKVNEPREREDINAFPYFDYTLLDLKHYLGPSPHYLLSDDPIIALNVLSSRGCPW